MSTNLRVGIIGANAERGWARESHIPAIRGVAGIELAAVANRSQASAAAAATAFGAAKAYDDPADLIADPNIDIVTITTAVPQHRDLILAALAANKHLYVEWPLTTNVEEAKYIWEAGSHSSSHVAVGLQARYNPAGVRARELISSGQIGRVLSVSVSSAAAGFGPTVPKEYVFLEDPATGMNIVTIMAGHALDFAIHVGGQLNWLSVLTTVQYPVIQVSGFSATVSRTVPEHVLAQGRLVAGGALTARIFAGRNEHTGFGIEIMGTDSTLTLTGDGQRGFQSGTLTLCQDGERVDIGSDGGALPPSAVNVAGVYIALHYDIMSGTTTAPGLADGLRLHQLLDDLIAADRSGARQQPTSPWPH